MRGGVSRNTRRRRAQQGFAGAAFERRAGATARWRPLQRQRAARGQPPGPCSRGGVFNADAELIKQALPGRFAPGCLGRANWLDAPAGGCQLQGVAALLHFKAALRGQLRLAQSARECGLQRADFELARRAAGSIGRRGGSCGGGAPVKRRQVELCLHCRIGPAALPAGLQLGTAAGSSRLKRNGQARQLLQPAQGLRCIAAVQADSPATAALPQLALQRGVQSGRRQGELALATACGGLGFELARQFGVVGAHAQRRQQQRAAALFGVPASGGVGVAQAQLT